MRDIRIDFLRALGLAMIVLAHVSPPALVMQLRNFDVPLMVLISGMSFGLSFKQEPFIHYLWRRIRRLVFPVWIFLSFYFCAIALLDLPIESLSASRVLRSYLLIDGIGYVWIIKVFLLVALVAPLIYRTHQRIASNRLYFAGVALIFFGYEAFRVLTQSAFATEPGKFIEAISHYLIPYALVFAIGLRLPSLSIEETRWGMNFCFALFIALALLLAITTGHFVPTQAHKYPPTLYYFSYALAVALLLWALSDDLCRLICKTSVANNLMLFAAQNSIWIYLWHIPLIKLINAPSPLKYLLVLCIAGTITYIQVLAVDKLTPRLFKQPASQRNIKMILTG